MLTPLLGQHFVMDKDAKCNAHCKRNAYALQQVLKEKCLDVDGIITNDDINKLVNEGFITAAVFAAFSKDNLYVVLPGRRGVVVLLSKAFVQPTGIFSLSLIAEFSVPKGC